MLSADCISVKRGDRTVLSLVDLDVRPGQVTAVVGPNGAGKSTLVAALTGRLQPESGEALLDGRPVSDYARLDFARRVSVLQQQFQTTFAFRAFEIVAMGRTPHEGRESRAAAARIVEDAMDVAGVNSIADRPANQLSGGERQRVFLARALAQIMPLETATPRFLLLDEPTASLDLSHQRSTLAFARDVAASGVGVLCVLHDLNLASRFADQAVVLQNGAVAAAGAPAEIFDEATVARVYGPGLAIFPDPETGAPVILPRGAEPTSATLPQLAAQAARVGAC